MKEIWDFHGGENSTPHRRENLYHNTTRRHNSEDLVLLFMKQMSIRGRQSGLF